MTPELHEKTVKDLTDRVEIWIDAARRLSAKHPKYTRGILLAAVAQAARIDEAIA